MLKQPLTGGIFPPGPDARGRDHQDLRWSRFKHLAPAELFTVVGEHVFPFIKGLGGDGSTYSHHMKDARFTIPTPALLAKVVDLIDQIPMDDRDTKGDLYEYMLGKIASTCAPTTRSSSATPPPATTSTRACSTATTSTPPCCASAA